MSRLLVASVLAISLFAHAFAADVPIQGDRARLADIPKTRRAQIVSYSAAIDLMSVDPTLSGSTLDIYSTTTGQQLTLAMPASQWMGPLPGRRFRFSATGNPKIKAVIVNGRMLKVVVSGAGGFPLGQPQGTVSARLTIGGTRFCTFFGGTITRDDGRRFVAQKAPAPAACPVAPNDACAGVTCTALDACHDVGVCNPQTGICSNPPKAEGVACDDGLACTASSSCQGGNCVSSDPTCRDEQLPKQNDKSYCDLSTGQCVDATACPAFLTDAAGNANQCTVLTGTDPTTGLCLYQPKVCPALGCNLETCNPATGACAVLQNDPLNCGASGNICQNGDFDGSACDVFPCAYRHCRQSSVTQTNCLRNENVNCAALNPSTCQLSLGCTGGEGAPGSGCEYSVTACAPPADPCAEELVMDGTTAGCCTYRAKDCAGRFGNNPNYTYACTVVGTAGVCTATPQ